MRLVLDVEEILREFHYSCLTFGGSTDMLLFEDENLLGAVAVFDSPDILLSNWSSVQQSFLESNAPHLRRAAEKSWNCYMVLLCPEPIAKDLESSLAVIEEDFASTRKIARCGLSTKEDVRRALLPLLPLQQVVTVGDDMQPDLQSRLTELPPDALAALFGNSSPSEIAAMLLEEK
jgi:hypothetical protein